jgi:hypothetical protein
MGVAFGGLVNLTKGIADAQSTLANLKSLNLADYFLDFGGSSLLTTLADIQNINMNAVQSAGYTGICYDLESFGSTVTASSLTTSFAAAKAKGLKVLIVACDAGCGISFIGQVLQSSYVAYVSPMLYTLGTESSLTTALSQTNFSLWKNLPAKVLASLPNGASPTTLYAQAQTAFSAKGITLSGYIVWA